MKQMIDQFTSFDLFGRDNYEYYARVTGRVLRVQDEWICSFSYPAPSRGKFTSSSSSSSLMCVYFLNIFNQKRHLQRIKFHFND